MHQPAYPKLVTCLAVYKGHQSPYTNGLAHHCRRELPHSTHRCACGIEWHDEIGGQD